MKKDSGGFTKLLFGELYYDCIVERVMAASLNFRTRVQDTGTEIKGKPNLIYGQCIWAR